MKKRMLSLALALVMVLSLLPFGASAAEITASGSCGESVTWTLDSDGLLTLSGSGPMENYDFQTRPSFAQYSDQIRSVLAEPDVTSVGSTAFWNCAELTSVTLPESVTNISKFAFSGCANLERITFPENLRSVGQYAFSNCTGLQSAELPDRVSSIGESAFANCTGLERVTLPNRLKVIDTCLFSGCKKLADIEIPSSVREIRQAAFLGCDRLHDVVIPEGVKTIETSAFSDCSSLKSIHISSTVEQIEAGVFYASPYLSEITVSDQNPVYQVVDNMLFSRTSGKLVAYAVGSRRSEIVIPDGVTSIESDAFYRSWYLERVTIPEGVTEIGDYAFASSTLLKWIALPSSLERVADHAFDVCSDLKDVLFGGTEEAWRALSETEDPDEAAAIQLPEQVRLHFGVTDPANHIRVETVTSPSGTVTEQRSCDCGFDYSPPVEPTKPKETSGACGRDTVYSLDPNGVLTISGSGSVNDRAFENDDRIRELVIEDGVEGVGAYAFSNCTNLTRVTLPESLTNLGGSAFSGCTGLTEITIPSQMKRIGSYLFSQCTALKTVAILTAAPTFGEYVFVGCSAVEDVFFAGGEDAWPREVDGMPKQIALGDSVRVHFHVTDPANHIRTETVTSPSGTVTEQRSCDCGFDFSGASDQPENPDNPDNPDEPVTPPAPGTEGIPRSPDLYSWITSDGTRYGLAHLLWYIAGEPQPVSAENPFLDVSEAMAPPVLWAVERGVLEPASENFFDLDLGLTRAEVVSAVWKYAGSPQPTIHAFPFTDVDLSAWYSQALLWAYEVGALRFEKMGTQFHPDEAVASMRLEPADGVLDMQGYAEDDMLPAQGRWFNYLLYNSSKTARLTGCWTVTQGDIVIPKTIGDGMYYVSEIGSKALRGRDQITSITIPSDVRKIGAFAFDGCTGLTDVYYGGCSPEGWNSILISGGNDPLLRARIHYSAHEYEANGRDDEGRIIYVCLRCHDTIKGVEKTTDSGVKLLAETGNHEAAPEIRLVARENTAETAGAANVVLQTVAETTQTRAFDIHLENAAGEAVQPEAAVTVTIPVPAGWDPNNVAVYYADPATGKTENMNARVSGDGRSVSFRTTHFSCYVLALKAKSDTTHTPSNPFSDVSAGAYYYDPVLWAVNHTPQITKGTGENTFSPGSTCTRGQVVTFLWRAMGCPNPKSTSNPFTDVKATDYYYQAVLWASENGITAGTSKTTFSPGSPCTRAHVVTFLWRAHGTPAAGASNPFRDVPAGQYYTDAVLWAVNHTPQITQGTGSDTFSPNNPCTRGQIVTFLYRDLL